MKSAVTITFGVLVLCAGLAANAGAQAPALGGARTFGVLGLQNGMVSINESTSLYGDVGYCAGVVSTTNQKVALFQGGAYVHSTATFSHTAATFAPSSGIHYGSSEPAVNTRLNQAYLDALAASTAAAALTPTHVLGVLGDNDSRTVTSIGSVNVVSITSLNYKEDYIQFVGRPGLDDKFIVNVTGNFAMDTSQIRITNGSAANILWNFPNASSIDIGKSGSVFLGTILAPLGTVIYHNPATFEGAIIALNISLHSAFNLTHVAFGDGPVPVENITWSGLKARF